MKILLLILGVVFTVFGLGLTGYSWYAASAEGKIVEGLSYAGPVLLVLGAWRVLSAMTASRPPTLFRMIAIVIGIAAGFGNSALIKATFPDDRVISTQSTH